MLGRKNKKRAIADLPVEEEETADLEVPLEGQYEEEPVEEVPTQAPVPIQQPPQVPVQTAPIARTMVREEPLKMQVIHGELTDGGFIYTIRTNKKFANIGDIINLQ